MLLGCNRHEILHLLEFLEVIKRIKNKKLWWNTIHGSRNKVECNFQTVLQYFSGHFCPPEIVSKSWNWSEIMKSANSLCYSLAPVSPATGICRVQCDHQPATPLLTSQSRIATSTITSAPAPVSLLVIRDRHLLHFVAQCSTSFRVILSG